MSRPPKYLFMYPVAASPLPVQPENQVSVAAPVWSAAEAQQSPAASMSTDATSYMLLLVRFVGQPPAIVQTEMLPAPPTSNMFATAIEPLAAFALDASSGCPQVSRKLPSSAPHRLGPEYT